MTGKGQKTVLVIGGPTASGKSGLALSVAKKKNGAIINADSIQLYNGLHILTAQPSQEDLAQAPHLLYGCLAPEDACSAARWRNMALAAIEETLEKDMLPIVTGGTGFYIRTLVQGISPIPDVPHEVRDRVMARQKELGNPAFHAELEKRDPEMAAKLHPFNTQRLVRAMEVLEETGKSLAEWQKQPPDPPPAHLKFVMATLIPPRALLFGRCDGRFGLMLKAGAMEQVKEFRKTAKAEMALAKAIGYPELCSHLDGRISLADAIDLAQKSTRHYAKRQVTWFRHQLQPDIVLEDTDTEKLIEAVEAREQSSRRR